MTTEPLAPQPANKRSGLRIAAIVAGALAVLAGIGVAAVGGLLLGLFGSDGTVASGSHAFSTARAALVSSVADIRDIADAADVVGRPRVRITARSRGARSDLFVGIGPAAQVDRYLASAPIDEVTDFELDPFKLTRRPRPGPGRPAPPVAQSFWTADATGRQTATLRWTVRDGDYRLVLMNADGSRGVDADGDVALTVPHLPAFAWALIGGGLLVVVGGAIAIALAVRRRRDSVHPAPPASAA